MAIMRTIVISVFFLLSLAFLLVGQQVVKPDPMRPGPEMKRPIDAHDSVFLEELTWIEIEVAVLHVAEGRIWRIGVGKKPSRDPLT